jgi:hypothetical protein
MKVVHVLWRDPAFGDPGWTQKKDAEEFYREPPPVADSIGFLVHECASHIVILGTVGQYSVSDMVKITREAILRMKTIGHIEPVYSLTNSEKNPRRGGTKG